jgi:hypothetical protein
MTSSRVAGWPLLIGAALLFLAQIPTTVLFGGDDLNGYAQHGLWVPTNLVAVAGAILLLWGLPLFAASPRAQALGWLGRAGSFLIFIGGALFGIFFSMLSAILLPYLATNAPDVFGGTNSDFPSGFFAFYVTASLCIVVGSVLLAVPLVRGLAFSRWPGYVLLAAAVAGVVGFFLSTPDSTPLIGVIIAGLNSFLLFIGLGWLGYQMNTMPADKEALSA